MSANMSQPIYEAKEPTLLTEAEFIGEFDHYETTAEKCDAIYAVAFRKKGVYRVEVVDGGIRIEKVV